jgi:methylglutaconyl-CoA hydratase
MTMLTLSREARGTATLTLDRPEARNALSAELVTRLTDALVALAADPSVRVVLLTGAGQAFCAGADIGDMRAAAAASTAENEADSRRFAGLLQQLEGQPQPTVALVNGAASGGAIGLIAACDIAIAAGSARFALSEVRLGLVPAMISPYVIRAIGARQAHRWFMTGEAMDAATAQRIGLVHETADDAALPEAARAIVEALLAGGPRAQSEIKRLLRHVTGRSEAADAALLGETSRWIARVRASDEGKEGLSAFLEKRRPRWRDPG